MMGDTLASGTDWPTFAHDLSRTSTQPASSAITAANVATLQLLWYYKAASDYDLASPIEYGGKVYAADSAGDLVAVDAAMGTVVWSRSFGVKIKATPAIYDGHLFVGTFNTAKGTSSNVFALDPATGATVWQNTVPGGVHGSPVAMSGRLYVPVSLGDPGYCDPGGVYAFDESGGGAGASWLVGGTQTNGGAVWSPLTYDGMRILYGTGNTCLTRLQSSNAVVALSTGLQQLWADQTADPFTDDDVGGGVIESGGRAYVTGKTGDLYAIDPASGAIAWQKNLGVADLDGSYATPSISGGTLMTSVGFRYDPYSTQPQGTQYGGLVGVDPATGDQRWSILAVSPFYNPPSIAGGMAFVTIDSALSAIDPATGSILLSTPLQGESRSAVAIAKGEVFVSDTDGMLYAFGLPTAANAALRARTARSLHITKGVPHFVNRIPAFCRFK